MSNKENIPLQIFGDESETEPDSDSQLMDGTEGRKTQQKKWDPCPGTHPNQIKLIPAVAPVAKHLNRENSRHYTTSKFVTCNTSIPKQESFSPMLELENTTQPLKQRCIEGEPRGLTAEVHALRKEMEDIKKNQREILGELRMIRSSNVDGFGQLVRVIDKKL